MNPNRLQLKISIGIAFLVLLVFGRTLDADFLLWDDPINVTSNELIKSLDAENLKHIFTDFETAARYKPLSWVAWAVLYQVFELDAAGYHMANVALHALNAVLVYLLLLALARRCQAENTHVERWRQIHWAAAIGALFWAIHPLRTEHVSWVTGFPYGLSLAPMLLATLFYLQLKPDRSVFLQLKYWGAAGLYLVAVLTYPIVLGFPAALIALDYFPLRKFNRAEGCRFFDRQARMVWLEKLPFVLVAGSVIGLTLFGVKHGSGDWFNEEQMAKFTLPAQVMQAIYMEAVYLWKTVLPSGLCPVYLDFFEIKGSEPHLLLGPVVVIAVSVAVFRYAGRWPAVPALWFAYLGLMAPFLGVTSYPHYPSDRYSIIAGIVLAVAVFAWLLRAGSEKGLGRSIPVALIVLLLFSVMSFRLAGTWHDNQVFFTRMTGMLPDGPHRGKAFYQMGTLALQEGKFGEAAAQFEKASQSCAGDPPLQLAYDHGVSLLSLGQPREALEQFNEALRWQGETTPILGNIGFILLQAGQHQQAADIFERLTQSAPGEHLAWMNLGVALAALGDGAKAIRALHQAREIAPNSAAVYQRLAGVLRGLGQMEAAAEAEERLKEITEP